MQLLPADTIIENVTVITMDPKRPQATGLAIIDGKIIGLLDEKDDKWPLSPTGKRINGNGMFLMPGLIDAHCHLRAMISYDLAIQCTPQHVQSIEQLIQQIKQRASQAPIGTWLKAVGYDSFYLHERRHPTRWDLDQASTSHPIRLRHITRHITVLNSAALNLVGIHTHSIDPEEITVDRDSSTGVPTGIIYGGDAWLSKHFIPPITPEEHQAEAHLLHQSLLSLGITSLADATPTNTLSDLQFWIEQIQQNWFIPIQLMTDQNNHRHLSAHYVNHLDVSLYNKLEIGPIKIVMESNPELVPTTEELANIALEAAKQKIPLAIHVVTPEMVCAALDAIRSAKEKVPNQMSNRLEHLSLCPEGFFADMEELNLTVVTNPSFLYEHGDRYLQDVEVHEQEWLYPMKGLLQNGIPLAAGSDAPVATVNPWIGMVSACTRFTKSGQVISSIEQLNRLEALELYTTNAAKAMGWETRCGMLRPEYDANFILLKTNPLTCSLDELKDIHISQTWIHGKLVYE